MTIEVKHYINLEDYNYRSVIFNIENCRQEFIKECDKLRFGKRYRFVDNPYKMFWFIWNENVDFVDKMDDIIMNYPVTIVELFYDEQGLYYLADE